MKHRYFKFLAFTLTIFLLIMSICNINIEASEIYVNARSAVAIDSKSKVVLYEKNAHMLVPMASTTKIMTALVAIKYGDLDKKIEISSKSAGIRGSTVGYKAGEMIPLRELIYGLMLRSGNDAAIAVAEGIGGSVEGFVRLMNEYAGQIGLCSTHFESPHGLDSENHYSTAYDLALVTSKARENKLFNDIVQSKDVDGKELGFTRSFHNINKILWELPNATGVKTGYTGKAGKCLVTSVDIKNNDVIIVVLDSPGRWKETKKINDYILKKYDYKKFFSKGDIVGEVFIDKANKSISLVTNDDVIVPVSQDNNYEVKIIKPNYKVTGPIKKGSKLGSLAVYENDKKIYSTNLESNNDVERKGIFKIWKISK